MGSKSVDGPAAIKPEVFLGRLPAGISKEQVESLCLPYQAVEVRMLENKGCAFARFLSFADAERAIEALHGTKFDVGAAEGINVQLADFKGAPKGSEKRPKVFVGGISRHCTEDAIRDCCSHWGHVQHAKIFKKGPSSPPCAFVTFGSFMEAEACIQSLAGAVNELTEEGKSLNVSWADIQRPSGGGGGAMLPPPLPPLPLPPQPQQQSAVPLAHRPPPMLPPPSAGMVSVRGVPVPPAPPPAQYSAPPSVGPCGAGAGAGALPPHKVFIGGLHAHVTEEFICGMMAPFGDVVEAKLLVKPGKDPCGFVRFATEAQGQDAISTLGARGRFTVQWANDRPGGGSGNAAGQRKRTSNGIDTHLAPPPPPKRLADIL